MAYLRIFVCDDEPAQQQALSALLKEITVPVSCRFFSCGEDLIKVFFPGCCDLILMDIYMGGMNGVETVAQIRAVDPAVPIAFLTTSPDFTMEGYQHRVDRYLLKPVKKEALEEVLSFAARLQKDQPSLNISIQGQNRTIPYTLISYIEQDSRSLLIHLSNGETLRVTMKISELASLLPSPPFYQCHKSFVINLSQVRYLDNTLKAFLMNGGGTAYIRRENLREAHTIYSRFSFDQIRGRE